MSLAAFALGKLDKVKFVKSAVFFFIIFFLFLFIFQTPTFAQNNKDIPQSAQSQKTLPTNLSPDVPQNLHTWTQTVMIEVIASMTCQIVGIDPLKPDQKCLGIGEKEGQIGFSNNNKGAVSFVGNMIGSLYTTPPIYTGDYFSYLARNFGFVKSANAENAAQSIGFVGLAPVMDLWKGFRNVSYFIFILIFLVVGVTVMLRIRIDPRTVMTIQNQIPKLIIGILLITFSFAIAGLLIDFMWVLIYLAISTIMPEKLAQISMHMTDSTVGFANYVFADQGGAGTGMGLLKIMEGGGSAIGEFIKVLFTSHHVLPNAAGDACNNALCELGNFWSDPIGNILGVILGGILGFIGGVIAFFIIGIALLVQLLKLWFKLLTAYVMIIFDVILAPIWIVAGLLPGTHQSFGFGSWLRDILGNLMVFPAVITLFLLGNVIFYNFKSAGLTTFNPPLIGNATESGNAFGALIALGIILMSPNVVDMVKKAFKPQGGAGPGFGGVTAGAAAMGAVGGAIGSRLYRKDPRTGEVRGAIGTRAQTLFGENVQRNARLKSLGRFTFGIQESEKLGKTKWDVEHPETPKSTTGTSGGGTPTGS